MFLTNQLLDLIVYFRLVGMMNFLNLRQKYCFYFSGKMQACTYRIYIEIRFALTGFIMFIFFNLSYWCIDQQFSTFCNTFLSNVHCLRFHAHIHFYSFEDYLVYISLSQYNLVLKEFRLCENRIQNGVSGLIGEVFVFGSCRVKI